MKSRLDVLVMSCALAASQLSTMTLWAPTSNATPPSIGYPPPHKPRAPLWHWKCVPVCSRLFCSCCLSLFESVIEHVFCGSACIYMTLHLRGFTPSLGVALVYCTGAEPRYYCFRTECWVNKLDSDRLCMGWAASVWGLAEERWRPWAQLPISKLKLFRLKRKC